MPTTRERAERLIARLEAMTPDERFAELREAAARLASAGLFPGTSKLVVDVAPLLMESMHGELTVESVQSAASSGWKGNVRPCEIGLGDEDLFIQAMAA